MSSGGSSGRSFWDGEPAGASSGPKIQRLESLWMRDPFLVSAYDLKDQMNESKDGGNNNNSFDSSPGLGSVDKERVYWLYGTTDKPPDNVGPYSEFPGIGFDCYCSKDLVNWEGPFQAFRRPLNFWADTQFWAPEVYLYQKRLILFATAKQKNGRERGVFVLESLQGKPEGPFVPVSNGPVTPVSWPCLDGTLYVENSKPYMVFCHEWTQVGDGEICFLEMSPDLKRAVSQPTKLFSASQAPWTQRFKSSTSKHNDNYITDGPFMHRSQVSGELIMLWSSIGKNDKYCVGVARSASGKLEGPWVHDADTLFSHDGGHAAITKVSLKRNYLSTSLPTPSSAKLSDDHSILILTLHSPNRNVRKSAPRLFGLIEELDESTGRVRFILFQF